MNVNKHQENTWSQILRHNQAILLSQPVKNNLITHFVESLQLEKILEPSLTLCGSSGINVLNTLPDLYLDNDKLFSRRLKRPFHI